VRLASVSKTTGFISARIESKFFWLIRVASLLLTVYVSVTTPISLTIPTPVSKHPNGNFTDVGVDEDGSPALAAVAARKKNFFGVEVRLL
jgi:hypothetical protein